MRTNELDHLIAQMPVTRDFLHSSVRLSDSAYAEVRLGPHFTTLGGARIGPYTIQARSKKDGVALIVVLCTNARFLNGAGQELPEARIEEAASVEEKLTGFMLFREGSAPEGRPPC